jgi:hypothetical protein
LYQPFTSFFELDSFVTIRTASVFINVLFSPLLFLSLDRTFDREKQGVYSFHVRATDAGQYNARWEEVEVQVTIADVNDHEPEFTEYPFTTQVPASVEAGHQLLCVSTHDPDDGVNSVVTYRYCAARELRPK